MLEEGQFTHMAEDCDILLVVHRRGAQNVVDLYRSLGGGKQRYGQQDGYKCDW